MKRTSSGFTLTRYLLLLLALLVLPWQVAADAAETGGARQNSYGTPQEAVQALVDGVKKEDLKALEEILGPGSEPLLSSGDAVADRAGRAEFVKLYEEKNHVDLVQQDKAVLSVGSQDYPVPIPMVKHGEKWLFDTKAGKEEILNRRIGRNELEAIEVAKAYVEAQREYASEVQVPGRPAEYAQRMLSTPGKKDGLYWDVKEGEDESPMGPLVTQATREGYPKEHGRAPIPYHGYYFRILKAQGKHASGGQRNYVVNGRMVRGFALVAYPAQYRVSGIMTFIVNQEGVVYQKDLGPSTAKQAQSMYLFDPDKSWKEVGGEEGHLPTVSDLVPAPGNLRLK